MRFLWIILTVLISGCASKPPLTMYKNDEQMMLKDSFVNLPMPFIYLSMENQNYIRCFEEQFCSLFPIMKAIDFKDKRYWSLMMYGLGSNFSSGYSMGIVQTLADGKGIPAGYDIDISVSISPYSAKDRALENGDEEFISKKYKQGIEERGGTYYQNGRIYYINAHIEKHGRENYACSETESYRGAENGYPVETYIKNISCGKINSDRTKVKTVDIKLVYQKIPNLLEEYEELAKDYTYENLQERAKRMLDSLYIKDGWDE